MKYGLAVVAFIVVAFLAIVFVINRGPSPTTSTNQPKGPVKLAEYDNKNASVSLTTKGELVGEEVRKGIRITVTPTERRLEILGGYGETVERTEIYENTADAYQAFLRGLERAGFTKTRKSTITDYRGVCPFGRQYVYDLSEGGASISNLWSTSCSTKQGTFDGQSGTIRRLFQLQITDYSKQVRGVDLDS